MKTVQISISLGALALGVVAYALHRGYLPLLGYAPNIEHTFSLGIVGDALPSFVHTFAFCLLTGAAISPRTNYYAFACIAWALINLLLELGQLEIVHSSFADYLEYWRIRNTVGDYVHHYFLHGTFDGWDVVATLLGAATAFIILETTSWNSRGLSAQK